MSDSYSFAQDKLVLCSKTLLHPKHNKDVIAYLDEQRREYAYILRRTFHAFNNADAVYYRIQDRIIPNHGILISEYRSWMQNEYHISSRTADAIIGEARGKIASVKELNLINLSGLKQGLADLHERLDEKTEVLAKLRKKVLDKTATDKQLESYQRNKRAIWQIKQKINRVKQSIAKLEKRIDSGKVNVCFGSKTLARKATVADASKRQKTEFLDRRDGHMMFIGDKNQISCNLNCQMTKIYDKGIYQFQMRKDFDYKDAKGDDKYVFGQVKFHYMVDEINQALQYRLDNSGKDSTRPLGQALTYNFVYKNGRYYMVCAIDINRKTAVDDKQPVVANCSKGVIGVDFNKDHLALSFVDNNGRLLGIQKIDYELKNSGFNKNQFAHIAKELSQLAQEKQMALAIEDLNFMLKKQKAKSAQGQSDMGKRSYNKMLHSLPYAMFKRCLLSRTAKDTVYLMGVNPAFTSLIGKIKFAHMKLNVHMSAAYTIARRALGFKDRYTKQEEDAYDKLQKQLKENTKKQKNIAKLAREVRLAKQLQPNNNLEQQLQAVF